MFILEKLKNLYNLVILGKLINLDIELFNKKLKKNILINHIITTYNRENCKNEYS